MDWMRTVATAGAEEVMVPEAGETESHGPPDVVDAEAENFNGPDPRLRIVRVWPDGFPPPVMLWKRKPVCESCKVACAPLTTTVTGTSNCDCCRVIDTVPRYVPTLRLLGSTVTITELVEVGPTFPPADDTESQFPPEPVASPTV